MDTTYQPIILFSMANDAQSSLRLAEEERSVREALADAHDEDRLEFHSLGHTNLDDIFDSINRFHRRLAVFHYSGHSNGRTLQLEDTPARSQSLSTLLGTEPELKLVFLNGCANRQQVNVLFEKGVRVVIATHAPIEDQDALRFSRQFYQSLAAGKTIRQAFDTAAAYLQNHDAKSDLKITRGIRLPETEEAFPWGLFYREEADTDWRLPLPEQLEETLARGVQQAGPADWQLEATLKRDTIDVDDHAPEISWVELETNDRRVQNSQGVFRIDQDALIGRSPECDIVILERGVSRRHARIFRQGGKMYLSDQNSTNGTYWNDVRISQIPLTEDGRLRLDEVNFKVRVKTRP